MRIQPVYFPSIFLFLIKGKTLAEVQGDLDAIYEKLDFKGRVPKDVEGGVEIQTGYKTLFETIREKYPTVELVPLDEKLIRTSIVDRNKALFDGFKKHNEELLGSAEAKAIIELRASPRESFDKESTLPFINKVLSFFAIEAASDLKIYLRVKTMEEMKEALTKGEVKAKGGNLNEEVCKLLKAFVFGGARGNGNRRPPTTRITLKVPASQVEELFAKFVEGDGFERAPSVRFINPEAPRRERSRANKKPRDNEGGEGRKPRGEGRSRNRDSRPRKPRADGDWFPTTVTVTDLAPETTVDDIKGKLSEELVTALGASRVSLRNTTLKIFCSEENGDKFAKALDKQAVKGATLAAAVKTDKRD